MSTDGIPEIELANMDCVNEFDAFNSSDESELGMPKLLARGDDDTSVSSDEHSITDYLEEHELPLPITRNHDEESAKTTQLDEEENEVALPSVSVPNKFNVLSSEDA